MCQPFRALPVFWGQHVKEEMAEGEKRISKASFPAQTLSGVWGLHCEDVGVLPSFLFHEGIDISNLLLVQVKKLSDKILLQAIVTILSCWCEEAVPKICSHLVHAAPGTRKSF